MKSRKGRNCRSASTSTGIGSSPLEKAQWVLGTQVTYQGVRSHNTAWCNANMFYTLTVSSSGVSRTQPANLFTEGDGIQIFKEETSRTGGGAENALIVFKFLPSCFSVQVTLMTSWKAAWPPLEM